MRRILRLRSVGLLKDVFFEAEDQFGVITASAGDIDTVNGAEDGRNRSECSSQYSFFLFPSSGNPRRYRPSIFLFDNIIRGSFSNFRVEDEPAELHAKINA